MRDIGTIIYAKTIYFREQWSFQAKLEIITRNKSFPLGWIIFCASWPILMAGRSALSWIWNFRVADALSWTHVSVFDLNSDFRAVEMVCSGVAFQSCSFVWYCTAAGLLVDNIRTSKKCDNSTFFSLKNIPLICVLKDAVPGKISAISFPTIITCTGTLYKYKKTMVPSLEMHIFVHCAGAMTVLSWCL